jgi:hypothetical protein
MSRRPSPGAYEEHWEERRLFIESNREPIEGRLMLAHTEVNERDR